MLVVVTLVIRVSFAPPSAAPCLRQVSIPEHLVAPRQWAVGLGMPGVSVRNIQKAGCGPRASHHC